MAEKKKQKEIPQESPVIILPEDPNRRRQLEAKLEEYKGRLDSDRHPGLQMRGICKKMILERLLRDGQVKTWDFSLELEKTYGPYFDLCDFDMACAVIKDYCETGGANARGGTGLPAIA